MNALETRTVTRRLASPHALASQVLYAARMAGPECYESEVSSRLQRLTGLAEWELAQVRSEVAYRMRTARSPR